MNQIAIYAKGVKFFIDKASEISCKIKTAVWYSQAVRSHTKSGFERKQQTYTSLEDINCEGMNVMITGGSIGVGKATAAYLIKRASVTIHIVCSEKEEGNRALEELKIDSHPSSKISLHIVDLTEPEEVYKFAKKFIDDKIPLDTLILCASKMDQSSSLNSLGVDQCFALNVVSPYILIEKFSLYMSKNTDIERQSIVISVTTSLSSCQRLHVADPMMLKLPYDGLRNFIQHKKQLIAITDTFAMQYPSIQYSSVCPGWVDTDSLESSLSGFYEKMKHDLRTPEQGADTIIWLAISPEALTYKTGELYFDRKQIKKYFLCAFTKTRKVAISVYIKFLRKVIYDMNAGKFKNPGSKNLKETFKDKVKEKLVSSQVSNIDRQKTVFENISLLPETNQEVKKEDKATENEK